MKQADKQGLINVLTILEDICKRHHDKVGMRHCRGCPFCKAPLYGCSFYSVLEHINMFGINLMKLKYNDDILDKLR